MFGWTEFNMFVGVNEIPGIIDLYFNFTFRVKPSLMVTRVNSGAF